MMKIEKHDIIKIFPKMFVYAPDKGQNKDNIDESALISKFEGMNQVIKCSKCSKISLNCCLCSKCSKVFCNACSKNITDCSSCNNQFNPKKLDSLSKKLIENIPVKCPSCKSILKIADYNNHLPKCYYSSYKCLICNKIFDHSKEKCYEHSYGCGLIDDSCSFCSKPLKKYLKAEHEQDCQKEIIECECNMKFERKIYNFHKKEECELRKVECPQCKNEINFKDLEGHKKNECEMRDFKCTECNDSYKFKDFQSHKERCKDIQIEKKNNIIKDLQEQLKQKDNTIKEFDFKSCQLSTQKSSSDIIQDNDSDGSENAKTKSEIINNNYFSNSSIISEDKIPFLNRLIDYKNVSLIYTMSKDGEDNFHKKCDGVQPTLCIIKISFENKGKTRIYGGYTSIIWDCNPYPSTIKKDNEAFIFSLTDQKEFKYCLDDNNYAILCKENYGPSFGYFQDDKGKEYGLWIKGKEGGYDYVDAYGDAKRICTGGQKKFKVEEIEVYQVLSQN